MKRLLGLMLAVCAVDARGVVDEKAADYLETMSEFSTAALTHAHAVSVKLHAAAEDLFYEPSAESRRVLGDALNQAYDAYLQAELYGLISMGGPSEVQRLIAVYNRDNCSADYQSGDSVMGLVASFRDNPEISADTLYESQASVVGGATGFRVLQFLQDTGHSADLEEAKHGYILAGAELLSRNIQELNKGPASDLMTTGDRTANVNRVTKAVLEQARRNLALLEDAACADDLEVSRVLVGNMRGLYQIWIGQLSGGDVPSISGTGLRALLLIRNASAAGPIHENIRSLYNSALYLGDKKVRRDKDQFLDAFSQRTRDEIRELLVHQISLWEQLEQQLEP